MCCLKKISELIFRKRTPTKVGSILKRRSKFKAEKSKLKIEANKRHCRKGVELRMPQLFLFLLCFLLLLFSFLSDRVGEMDFRDQNLIRKFLRVQNHGT